MVNAADAERKVSTSPRKSALHADSARQRKETTLTKPNLVKNKPWKTKKLSQSSF